MLTETITADSALPAYTTTPVEPETSMPAPYEFRAIPAQAGRGSSTGVTRGWSDEALREAVECARSEAYEEGLREGRCNMRSELEVMAAARLAQERANIGAALKEFTDVRNRYFAAVEQEVVRLSLAIASRVLHREVQLDPMLLSGVVRVALSQLTDRSNLVLRVPAAGVTEWSSVFADIAPADRPSILADASLAAGECSLDTNMGSVELGIAAQLEEIERGFFDLLSHRPAS